MDKEEPFKLQYLTTSTILSHTTLSACLKKTKDENRQQRDVKNGVLTFFLDRSGSMSGRPINIAKQALCEALNRVFKLFLHIYVVAFDEDTSLYTLSGMSLMSAQNTIQQIRSGGGTHFSACFKEIHRLARRHSKLDHTVVFLTDGCDNSGLSNPTVRNEAIFQLKSVLHGKTKSCVFHSIGFSSSHDASMLTSLTRAGDKNGTFIYVNSAHDIQNAVDEVFTISARPSVNVTIDLYDANDIQIEGVPSTLRFESEDDCEYVASMLLPKGIIPSSAEFTYADVSEKYPIVSAEDKWVQLDEYEIDSPELSVQYATDVFNIVTAKICHDVAELPLKVTDKSHLNALKSQYEDLPSQVFNRILPRLSRVKEAKTLLIESLSLIKRFFADVLSDALRSGGFENEKYAQLASIAYRGVRNRKAKNLLGKRAAQNVGRMDNLDNKITEVVEQIDFNSDLFADVEEYGQCIFTFMDYKQALMNGDCMCLGIEIQRPEAAIADPSRIIVKRISTTLITAESFLNAVQYGLRPDSETNATEIHGGFEIGESGCVIIGQSREIINGGLPLFINESHWQVARLRQKPLYGWMATLDVLGFSTEQVITIPFLVLKTIRSQTTSSEYYKRLENWVLQTCIRVFEESHILGERLFGNGGNRSSENLRYLQYPEARLPDVVPSGEVFCIYMRVAANLPSNPLLLNKEETSCLGTYVVIEEWRRRLRAQFCSMSSFGVENAIGSSVGVSASLLENMKEELTHMEHFPTALFDDYLEKMVMPQWSSSTMNFPENEWKLFESICGNYANVIEGIPVFSNEQKMAIYTLHLEYPRSSDVRSSETYGQKLAMSLSHPKKVLRKRFARSIQIKLKEVYTNAMKDAEMYIEKREFQKFLKVETLEEAANIIGKRLYIGRNVGYYANALGGIPIAKGHIVDCIVKRPFEKICMLMNGVHSGKNLYLDKDDKKRKALFGGLSWKPRKEVVRRLFKRYAIDPMDSSVLRLSGVSEEVQTRWKKAFPWQTREINIWSREQTENWNRYSRYSKVL